ncbi:MAG TPA: cell division protein FtsL [Thiothrix sp.]|nr:cell division protein FtsL [Thiothrix sp.]
MKTWQLPLLLLLYVAVIFVAIKVVMNRHEARTLYGDLQSLEKEHNRLIAQWSRLKLEEGTLFNQVVVERRAKQELNMIIPKHNKIRVIVE